MPTPSIALRDEIISSAIAYGFNDRWNATQNRTSRSLHDRGETISDGLAKRLAHYARRRVADEGWSEAIMNTEVHISTVVEYSNPADRSYEVRFFNNKGGAIGVSGILTSKGWPALDHGLFMDRG